MTEWWSYRLSDFLLFSPRTYWRLFELHNEALWPLPAVTLALGVAVLVLAVLRPKHSGRPTAILLAILWVFVGWSFLWQRYATINWAAIYAAPLFAVEGLLLLMLGGLTDRLSFGRCGARRIAGIALIAVGLAYPLLASLLGRPWQGAEVFGIAPDPTAIATLGFVLLARGRWAWLLYPIPVLWCLAGGLTLWAMNEGTALVPLLAALSPVLAIKMAGHATTQRCP